MIRFCILNQIEGIDTGKDDSASAAAAVVATICFVRFEIEIGFDIRPFIVSNISLLCSRVCCQCQRAEIIIVGH